MSTLHNADASFANIDDAKQRRETAMFHKREVGSIGNHFCILQPILSAGKSRWREEDVKDHIALKAFLRTFVDTVTAGERGDFKFSMYYGHDSDDAVLGDGALKKVFVGEVRKKLEEKGFVVGDGIGKIGIKFIPLYGLHGRINAIWNFMAKDAYYDGCDYFFMSNDDMVFYSSGWVARAKDSLLGKGSNPPHERKCRNFGIVRFKDEWANWATFTFHVSTRLHMDIFGGVYYPVPYETAHNDYWIHWVYKAFDSSKYRGEVKVRNRVGDVDWALEHRNEKQVVAKPRYEYGKKGNIMKHIMEGRARVREWLKQNNGTTSCLPPL